MLIFDQLKKNDPQLRLLATVILASFLVLVVGLWWVQIVHARDYRRSLQAQSSRSVRVPAVRGKILDRNGTVLAESRPNYSVSCYLEDLSPAFREAYQRLRPRRTVTNSLPLWQRWLGIDSVKTQRVKLSKSQIEDLEWQARYDVGNLVVQQVAAIIPETPPLDPNKFRRHYASRLALPFPIVDDLDPAQITRFEELSANVIAVDLETETTRIYPCSNVASHVIGYVRRNNDSAVGEEAFFSYRLPDFRGAVGIERYFDDELRGRAGAKSVVVNNLGYRQTETVWEAAEPGRNVVLTLDLRIQLAAERAMRGRLGAQARGAVVVMDVRSGDLLALVSSPASDPNMFVKGIAPAEMAWLTNTTFRPLINRATQENYAPGSIFKTIVGLACLEAGLNPEEEVNSPGHVIYPRYMHDTGGAGLFDFRRALLKSSNFYFVTNGLRYGIANIVALAERFHLGERTGLFPRQETSGNLPSLERVTSQHWRAGETANICIGQGALAVTPLQMAVMTSALANGGKVFWPRVVQRIESQDPMSAEPPTAIEKARLRDQLGVRPSNLEILHKAMLADTEDSEGTACQAFNAYYRNGGKLRVCGKTGTAQVQDIHNRTVGHNLWFISFAPYENPRYAVVVMAEGAGSGGGTCAPVARDIYEAIQKTESETTARNLARAD